MSLELPEEMRWLGWIAGAPWPDGDEDLAWAVAAAWERAGTALNGLLGELDEVKRAALESYISGSAPQEMVTYLDQLRTGDQSLEALAANMLETADSAFGMGTELQAMKLTIIVTLCWLAIEIALAWLFPPTAPAVEASAIATARATLGGLHSAVQNAIARLAAKLGAPTVQRSFWRSLFSGKPVLPTAKGLGQVGSVVLTGAAGEAVINGAIQAGQLADGKRKEFNWEEFGISMLSGAAAGPVALGVGKAFGKGLDTGFGFGPNWGSTLNDTMWGALFRGGAVGAVGDGIGGIVGSIVGALAAGQSIADALEPEGLVGGFVQGGLAGASSGGANFHHFGGAIPPSGGFAGPDGSTGGGPESEVGKPVPARSGPETEADEHTGYENRPAPEKPGGAGQRPLGGSEPAVYPAGAGPSPASGRGGSPVPADAGGAGGRSSGPAQRPDGGSRDADPERTGNSTSGPGQQRGDQQSEDGRTGPAAETIGSANERVAAAKPLPTVLPGGPGIEDGPGIAARSGDSDSAPIPGRPLGENISETVEQPGHEQRGGEHRDGEHTGGERTVGERGGKVDGGELSNGRYGDGERLGGEVRTAGESGPEREGDPNSGETRDGEHRDTEQKDEHADGQQRNENKDEQQRNESNDEQHEDGQHKDGENKDGENKGGERGPEDHDGKHEDGERGHGEHRDGEHRDGEHRDGERRDGERRDGERSDFQADDAARQPAPTQFAPAIQQPAPTVQQSGPLSGPAPSQNTTPQPSPLSRTDPLASTNESGSSTARPRPAPPPPSTTDIPERRGGTGAQLPPRISEGVPRTVSIDASSKEKPAAPETTSDEFLVAASLPAPVEPPASARRADGHTGRAVPKIPPPPVRQDVAEAREAGSDLDRSSTDTGDPLHRRYGPGNLAPVRAADTAAVLRAFGDPTGGYVIGADPRMFSLDPSLDALPLGKLINGAGPGRPGRNANCFDCVVSALSSFYGRPRAAAPVAPVVRADGTLEFTTEGAQFQRRDRIFGAGSFFRRPPNQSVDEQYRMVTDIVTGLGPGSAAFVHINLRDGGAHTVAVVYPNTADGPVWWDPQQGTTDTRPPAELVAHTGRLEFIPLTRDRGIEIFSGGEPANRQQRMAAGPPRRMAAPEVHGIPVNAAGAPPPGDTDAPPPREHAPDTGPAKRARSESEESEHADDTLPDPKRARTNVPEGEEDSADSELSEEEPDSPLVPPEPAPRVIPPRSADNPLFRVYGPGNLVPPSPERQAALEQAMDDGHGGFVTFADPSSHAFADLVNGDHRTTEFKINCNEACLAGLSSFYGSPQAAAAVAPAQGPDGTPEWVGEQAQHTRLVPLFAPVVDLGPAITLQTVDQSLSLDEQADRIHDYVERLGPGSSALVRNTWPGEQAADKGEDGHAYLIVFPMGADEPVWWDPQTKEFWDDGPPWELGESTRIEFLALTPWEGLRVFAPEGTAADRFDRIRWPIPEPSGDNPLRRVYGAGNLGRPDPVRQAAVAAALSDGAGGSFAYADPHTYPSPEQSYGGRINPHEAGDIGHEVNGFDAAMAGLSTFHGYPQAAAPVLPIDTLGDQLHVLPELAANQRLNALFAPVRDLRPGLLSFASQVPDIGAQVEALDNHVHALGTGGSAYVRGTGPGGRVRHLVVVVPEGAGHPVWWEPGTGTTWDDLPELADLTDLEFAALTGAEGDRVFGQNQAPEAGGSPDRDTGEGDPSDGDSDPGESEAGEPASGLEAAAGTPWEQPAPSASDAQPVTEASRDTGPVRRPSPTAISDDAAVGGSSAAAETGGDPQAKRGRPGSVDSDTGSPEPKRARGDSSPRSETESGPYEPASPDDSPELPEGESEPGPQVPPRSAGNPLSRVFGPGNLVPPDPARQAALENALSDGHGGFAALTDPHGGEHPYGPLINGDIEQPGFRFNCHESCLAGLSTFYGVPQVAAALAPITDASGNETWVGELAQNQRLIELFRPLVDFSTRGLQSFASTHPDMYDQADAITRFVADLGPGSSAFVRNMWPATQDGTEDGHAYLVLYPLDADAPVWLDPQTDYLEDPAMAPLELDESTEIEFVALTPWEGFQIFGPAGPAAFGDFLRDERPLPVRSAENPLLRRYGAGYLIRPEQARADALEQALDDGAGGFYAYADPRSFPPGGTPFGQLINPHVPGDIGRQVNGFDAALAALSTFNGYPQVAASVMALNNLGPTLRFLPEPGRDRRLIDLFAPVYDLRQGLLGFDDARMGPAEQVAGITQTVHDLGWGASAYVHGTGPGGADRSLVVVFPQGAATPVWWDPGAQQFLGDPAAELSGLSTLRFVPLSPDQGDAVFAPPPVADSDMSDAESGSDGDDPTRGLDSAAGLPWLSRPADTPPAGPEPEGYRNRARPQRRFPDEWSWPEAFRAPRLPGDLWSAIVAPPSRAPAPWWPRWGELRAQMGDPGGQSPPGAPPEPAGPLPGAPDVDVPFTLR